MQYYNPMKLGFMSVIMFILAILTALVTKEIILPLIYAISGLSTMMLVCAIIISDSIIDIKKKEI